MGYSRSIQTTDVLSYVSLQYYQLWHQYYL
nr:MAG TPA: hypothetical protein [Caudoviricetes sp.]